MREDFYKKYDRLKCERYDDYLLLRRRKHRMEDELDKAGLARDDLIVKEFQMYEALIDLANKYY